jgi:hypothetical protein
MVVLHRPLGGRQPLDLLVADLAQDSYLGFGRVDIVNVTTDLPRPGAGRCSCGSMMVVCPGVRSDAPLHILSLSVFARSVMPAFLFGGSVDLASKTMHFWWLGVALGCRVLGLSG